MTSQTPQASTDFSALALSPAQLSNLQQLGYTSMTPIQAASLPPALLGKDLIAQASTGSGKTAAFGLALLARLNPRCFGVQALVLCPTASAVYCKASTAAKANVWAKMPGAAANA